jgi:hypothetical protein
MLSSDHSLSFLSVGSLSSFSGGGACGGEQRGGGSGGAGSRRAPPPSSPMVSYPGGGGPTMAVAGRKRQRSARSRRRLAGSKRAPTHSSPTVPDPGDGGPVVATAGRQRQKSARSSRAPTPSSPLARRARGGRIHGGVAPSSLSGGQARPWRPDPRRRGPLLSLRRPGVWGQPDPRRHGPLLPQRWPGREVGRICDSGAWGLGSPVGLERACRQAH